MNLTPRVNFSGSLESQVRGRPGHLLSGGVSGQLRRTPALLRPKDSGLGWVGGFVKGGWGGEGGLRLGEGVWVSERGFGDAKADN